MCISPRSLLVFLITQAGKPVKHLRRFGSTTRELAGWLREFVVEHVGMESLARVARAMLGAIIDGEESSERLANLALGHLRAKIPQIETSLEGHVRDHHRFLLRGLLRQLQFLEAEIALLDARLDQIGQEHRNLLEARMKIYPYNQHTRLLSFRVLVSYALPSLLGLGEEPTLLSNQSCRSA